jgi:hypothetical protein
MYMTHTQRHRWPTPRDTEEPHTETQLALTIRHRVKTIKNGPHPETQLALAIRHRVKTIKNGPHPETQLALAIRHRVKTIKNALCEL